MAENRKGLAEGWDSAAGWELTRCLPPGAGGGRAERPRPGAAKGRERAGPGSFSGSARAMKSGPPEGARRRARFTRKINRLGGGVP